MTNLIPFESPDSIILPSVEDVLAGQLKQSSIKMYKRDIQKYLDFAHHGGYDQANAQTLILWRDDMVLHTAMSPHTINRMLSAVKRLILEAYRRQIVPMETMTTFTSIAGVSVGALQERLKRYARTRIEPEDMRRLCEEPDQTTLVGLRDAALLATLASSGMRASELATLQREHIKRRKEGYIAEVLGKTDTKLRDVHVSAEAHKLIEQWIEARRVPSSYVFTSFKGRGNSRATDQPLSANDVWKLVIHYASACELSHVKPHDFRRFVGTQLAAKDLRKAQLALGHKSIEVTARHYILDEIEPGLTDNLY